MNSPLDDQTPFDDLSEDELKEMVEFCKKRFTFAKSWSEAQERLLDEGIPIEEHFNPSNEKLILWEWKRGDWFWDPDYDDKIPRICLLDNSNLKHFTRFNYPNAVPLPLAHQWVKRIAFYTRGYLYYFDGEWCFQDNGHPAFPRVIRVHRNPHYTCYLAFRKVIEDV